KIDRVLLSDSTCPNTKKFTAPRSCSEASGRLASSGNGSLMTLSGWKLERIVLTATQTAPTKSVTTTTHTHKVFRREVAAMSQSLAEGLQGGVNIGWPTCRTVVPMTPGAHETMSTRIQQLRAFAATRATHTRSFRMDQLKALRELFEDYATDIQDALWQDIG